MKKSTKVILSAAAIGTVIAGTTAIIVSQKPANTISEDVIGNPNTNFGGNQNGSTSIHASEDKKPVGNYIDKNTGVGVSDEKAAFSLRKNPNFTRATFDKMYVLTISQTFDKGEILLYNEAGEQFNTEMPVNPGDKITVKVRLEKGFEWLTLKNIKVWSATENFTVATVQEGEEYSFVLPEATCTDWQGNTIPNPFYNDAKTINVKPEFTTQSFNDWNYDYNTKAFVFKITEETLKEFKDAKLASEGRTGIFVGDSKYYTEQEKKTSPNLDLAFLGEYEKDSNGNILVNQYGNKIVKQNTNFVIDLNGYDLYLSHLTIPSGVTLGFHNSKVNQFDPYNPDNASKTSRLYGDKRIHKDSVDMHGGMVFAWGVQRMTLDQTDPYTGQYVERDHWWIEGYTGDGERHGTYANNDAIEHKYEIVRNK